MTCIVGLIDNDNIYVGGDSAGVAGYSLYSRKDEKVFIKSDMIFGFTSSFRMGQILRYKLNIPPYYPQNDLFEYMVNPFIDSIRRCFKDSGYMSIDKSTEEGGTFIIGFKGRLFTIENDFQVAENNYPFAAVGCGESYALASMATSEGIIVKPEERVIKALEMAEKFNCGVRGPFTILKLPK